MDNIALEASWKKVLLAEFSKPYMQKLKQFLISEQQAKKIIYPKNSEIFNAFNFTPFSRVKVVIVGQDPYHGSNQAHGLCFSVQPSVALPPSLVNVYKELYSDLAIKQPHGCLINWAKQGVLLLNSVLTVQSGLPGSHSNKGWEIFTDQVISSLNNHASGIIFLLWGNYALKKGAILDHQKHTILKAAHPSPLSANRGFFGCRHFSITNKLLKQQGMDPIDWQI